MSEKNFEATIVANENSTNSLGSALTTVLKRRDNFINQGNTALKEEVVSNPSDFKEELQDITTLTVQKFLDTNQINEEQLKELVESAANSNLFPPQRPTPDALVDTVNALRDWVDAEREKLDTFPFSIEGYHKRRARAQYYAAYLLILECYIGEQLLKIEPQKGVKAGSKRRKTGKIRTKKEIIRDDYHLSVRQARDFQHLTWEGVKAAIEIALKQNEIPTRALALSKSAKAKADANKTNKNIKHTKFKLDFIEETEVKTLHLDKPMYYTSLFANIGMGCCLLDSLNIICGVFNELDPQRFEWHSKIYASHRAIGIQGDFMDPKIFEQVVEAHIKSGAELVLASPCCEPFSLLNNSPNKGKEPEARLFYYTAEFIKRTKPKYFVIENVPGFVDAKPQVAHDVLKDEKGNIRCIGQYLRDDLGDEYHLNFGIYSAESYGVAESRERVIVLGCRKDISDTVWKFPAKTGTKKMLWEVIGDLKSLANGEVDPDDPWHYARKLPDYLINFLEVTPTGCSAWDNDDEHQPLTDAGEPSCARFNRGFTRCNWQDTCPTITTGNGSIGDLYSIHCGRYDCATGKYTDCRVFSLRELIRISACRDDFLDALDLPRDENGMLDEKVENSLRKAIGQHFCAPHVRALMTSLPIPANDNITQTATSETETADTVESDKAE